MTQVGIPGNGPRDAAVPSSQNIFLGLGLPDLKMPGVPLSQGPIQQQPQGLGAIWKAMLSLSLLQEL